MEIFIEFCGGEEKKDDERKRNKIHRKTKMIWSTETYCGLLIPTDSLSASLLTSLKRLTHSNWPLSRFVLSGTTLLLLMFYCLFLFTVLTIIL